MTACAIYQDQQLYGHALLNLPSKICAFSQDEFCLYDRPDPGTLVVYRDYLIAKVVQYRHGNTYTHKTEFIFEKPLLDSIEFIGRRILGSCVAAVSFLIFPLIGFTVKLLDFGLRQVSGCIAATTLAEKINQIWNNADLFGQCLTAAPANCYEFATAPLSWHLRADGTDRRSYIYVPARNIEQEAEWELVPFEFFEGLYRRVFGGALTLAAGIVSPLGLVAKSVHLLGQSIFQIVWVYPALKHNSLNGKD